MPFWPKLWTGLRFLVPVLPLLVVLFFDGSLRLWGTLAERARIWKRGGAILVALWIILGLKNQVELARGVRAYPPVWDAYFRAAAWIRQYTKPDDLIVDRKAALLAYATDRRVVSFPRESDPKRMLAWMEKEGVDYVLVPEIPYDDIQRYLIPAISAEQRRFYPAFEVEEPYTVLLCLLPAPP